jgi:hypothetical protein
MISHLKARVSNPCFDDVRLRVSADVLLEGTREQSDRRGLLRMASDVITFVITSLFYGQCLEAIKFKRSDAPRRKILSAASSSFGRKNTSIGLRAFYWLIMKRIV